MGRRSSTKLSDRTVERGLPKEGKATLTDAEVVGLYIEGNRFSANWRLRRQVEGRRERVRLGKWPVMTVKEARRVALEALSGRPRPVAQARATGPSLEALIEQWAEVKKHRKSIYKAKQDLLRDLKPLLKKPVATLDRKELMEVLDAKQAKAPTSYRRVAGEVRTMLRWAGERDLCDPSLVAGIKVGAAARRDHTPTVGECREIWIASEILHPVVCGFFRFLLLTGLRTAETQSIEWDWIEGDSLVLPAETTKSNRKFIVPLSKQALQILDGLEGDSRLVFTHGNDKKIGRIHANRDKIVKETGGHRWMPHDFRRALVSWLAQNGCPLNIADKMLNHSASQSMGGVLAHYMHYDFYDERKEWLGKWSETITK